MSQITFEQILYGIQSLPPEEIEKLREILNVPDEEQRKIEAARALAKAASLRDFSRDRQWLKEHRHEFAGYWVALMDGQLISHSRDAKAVFAAVREAGHPDALVVLVEPEPEPGHKIINLG
jgi:hypothetical protein